jgi:Flp pilus assembly protein TadD
MKRQLKIWVLVFFLSGGFLFAQNGALGGASGGEPRTSGSSPAASSVLYEKGRQSMLEEDWYAAAEYLIESLHLNPAHSDATSALAECYYEMGEFDQALVWVRRARGLSRADTSLTNLEAFTLIALGRLDEASAIVNQVLQREPYNREALFAAAELDIARGRAGDAVIRYRSVVSRYPDDRRLLVSLALVLGSLGDADGARSYI